MEVKKKKKKMIEMVAKGFLAAHLAVAPIYGKTNEQNMLPTFTKIEEISERMSKKSKFRDTITEKRIINEIRSISKRQPLYIEISKKRHIFNNFLEYAIKEMKNRERNEYIFDEYKEYGEVFQKALEEGRYSDLNEKRDMIYILILYNHLKADIYASKLIEIYDEIIKLYDSSIKDEKIFQLVVEILRVAINKQFNKAFIYSSILGTSELHYMNLRSWPVISETDAENLDLLVTDSIVEYEKIIKTNPSINVIKYEYAKGLIGGIEEQAREVKVLKFLVSKLKKIIEGRETEMNKIIAEDQKIKNAIEIINNSYDVDTLLIQLKKWEINKTNVVASIKKQIFEIEKRKKEELEIKERKFKEAYKIEKGLIDEEPAIDLQEAMEIIETEEYKRWKKERGLE